jgi:hypothetical protein
MNKLDIFGTFIIVVLLFICSYKYLDNLDSFELKCIVSTIDGNKYCVRDRKKLQDAVDLLARVTAKCKKLVDYLKEKYGNQDNVKRLVTGFNPKQITETLPTSSYTAYSENKGEKIAFCLNIKKGDNDLLIDENTLTFVALHELSHVATKSIGHKREFWDNFKFILEKAKEAGIHDPVDYKNTPQEYCGMKIHDNPYYDT